MAFPEDVLGIKVELSLDGTWTDVTDYVYKDRIEIERGSADESSYSQPTRATFMLNNVDGRFSPRNPNGPYYGLLKQNLPVLISVQDGESYLDVPRVGRASTSDISTPTGDLDIAIELQSNNWADWERLDGDLSVELIAQMEVSVGGWMLAIQEGRMSFRYIDTWPSTIGSYSERPVIPPSGRVALRCTVDASTGAVTYYQADSIDGEWVLLDTVTELTGPLTWAATTVPLSIGDAMESSGWSTFSGKVFAARVATSIGGEPAVDVDFTSQTAGDTAFTDSAGADWIVEDGASINRQWNRFKGEVSSWPTSWTTGGHDAWVRMSAQTLLRRFTQGNRQLRSALARRLPTAADVVAYWPMEEPDGATQFYSPMPNVRPMWFNGSVEPGAHAGPPGSDDLPSMSAGANWFGRVRGGSPTGWSVEAIVNPQQLVATDRIIYSVQTSGTIRIWRVAAGTGGVRVVGLDRDGVIVADDAFAFTPADWLNQWSRMRLNVVQAGSDITWRITLIPIGATGFFIEKTAAGQSCGRVLGVGGPDSGDIHEDLAGISVGHMSVMDATQTPPSSQPYFWADEGFESESAFYRIVRVADEEGERVVVTGRPEDTEPMGAQRPDRFVDLLRECATADAGIFTDNRDVADWEAFKFIPRSSLENQEPTMILDYEGDDGLVTPMDPTDDDLYLRNAITMERERGSSYYVELATGANSIEEVGEYPGGEPVNLYLDSQLPSRAGWELHLGTWDEERYPTIVLKLQNATHKIPEWLKTEQGSIIRIVNARNSDRRTFIPPGDLNLMVRGYREHLSQFEWEAEIQCVPAGPYDVAVLEALGNRAQHLDTAGAGLTASLDTTETAIAVTTTSGPAFTDNLYDYPFDLLAGGEAMTAIAPGRLLTPNPLTETDITGWTASNCTAVWSQERVHPDRHAVAGIKVTPNGVSASGSLAGDQSATGSVQEGDRVQAGVWIFAVEGLDEFKTAISWYTSAGAFISTSTGTVTAIPPQEWTWVEQEATAPATASRAAMGLIHTATPAASAVYYLWAPRVAPLLAAYGFDSFGRTVASGWGTDEQGNTWTNDGGTAANYAVGSGYGSHTLATAGVSRRTFIDLPATAGTFDVYCDITVSATATGGTLIGGLVGRYTDIDNFYLLRVDFTTGGATQLILTVSEGGTQTTLSSKTSMLPAYSAGTFLRMRFQGSGTTLRGKLWAPTATPEPQWWHVSATDSVHAAGDVGMRSITGTGNTNVNPQIRYDNFEVRTPQRMIVARSANGVVKAQSSATEVTVRYPIRLAM